MVTHIDDTTIAALTEFYRTFLPEGGDVLDLMSSWISHLPEEREYGRVVGLGMNAEELAANPRLDDWCVHNLNNSPHLPFDADSFDRAVIAVSIQYLVDAVGVLSSVREVLREGGQVAIAMSHRLFPTKAVAAFAGLPPNDRIALVFYYLEAAGFTDVQFTDASPEQGDPLWIVTGRAG